MIRNKIQSLPNQNLEIGRHQKFLFREDVLLVQCSSLEILGCYHYLLGSLLETHFFLPIIPIFTFSFHQLVTNPPLLSHYLISIEKALY